MKLPCVEVEELCLGLTAVQEAVAPMVVIGQVRLGLGGLDASSSFVIYTGII